MRRKSISNKQIDKFIPKDCDEDLFKKAMLSVNLETLCFVSNDESDVAKVIRKETINLLSGRGFYVKGDILKVYNALWKEIYDMSKQAREIDMIDLAYDTKIYIHEMFSNIYEKSLFNYNTNKKIQDEYLNLKWGSQKQKSHNTKDNKFMAKGRKTTYDEKIEIVVF